MQGDPHYEDVVSEVAEFLRQRVLAAIGYGMAVENIAIDPGIGFGKRPEHNLALIRSLGTLAELGRPILVGVSRKSFLHGDRGQILAGGRTHKLLSREMCADIPGA